MMTSSDEFDNEQDDDILDLVSSSLLPNGSSSLGQASRPAGDRLIRKRSSKACDNCRKAKCKCERSPEAVASGDPCRNCILLGAECTFLGPSRKRGPPKGYIDALESKLHQLEALLGVIITSTSPSTTHIINALSQDPLAREVIQRVDDSPFGTRGRKQARASRELYGRGLVGHGSLSGASGSGSRRKDAGDGLSGARFGFGIPPHEWQDTLEDLLSGGSPRQDVQDDAKPSVPRGRPTAAFTDPSSASAAGPSKRRRVDHSPSPPPMNLIVERGLGNVGPQQPPSPVNRKGAASRRTDPTLSRRRSAGLPILPRTTSPDGLVPTPSSHSPSDDDSESESELVDSLGQLSVNELHQVRYHGKASGLHFLMPALREKGTHVTSDGGMWDFPQTGVWPLVKREEGLEDDGRIVAPSIAGPRAALRDADLDAAAASALPEKNVQEHLLGLYFTYVHPILPVLHKKQFLGDFNIRNDPSHPLYRDALNRIPNLLLLAMFSVAARYSDQTPLPEEEGTVWTAGDAYFDKARELIVSFYSLSRPETAQALLLMGYRDIGLGTMAQAWHYIGIAIRVAQDLGLHRSIAKWALSGQAKFSQQEKEVRARIWHACVRMDKYVSTYIGRPLTVYEHDFDAQLPELDEEEESELWHEYPSFPHGITQFDQAKVTGNPQPSRVISCFRASIALSNILGSIVYNFYSIRLPPSQVRHRERANLSHQLQKWQEDLPEHLKIGGAGGSSPHVFTLHMQYWTTVLLLNRPFIRLNGEKRATSPSSSSSSVELGEERIKLFSTCQTAAHQITNIATAYSEAFCIRRSPALFTYYIFTASIMHVTSLMRNPGDGAAVEGLTKTMNVLKRMSVVWPSATRAWDLLNGVNIPAQLNNSIAPKQRLVVDTEMNMAPRVYGLPTRQSPSIARPSSGGQMGPPQPVQSSRTPHSSTFSSMHQTYNPVSLDMGFGNHQVNNAEELRYQPAPTASFVDSWGSQNGNPSPIYPHAPESQMVAALQGHPGPSPSSSSHNVVSISRQGSIQQEHRGPYGFGTSPMDLPDSYTQSIVPPGRPSSQHSQGSYHDSFNASPVPVSVPIAPGAGTFGGWNDYQQQVGDPFGDPSLLAAYPGEAPGLQQSNGMHSQQQLPGYSSMNTYFAPSAQQNAFFGHMSRPN